MKYKDAHESEAPPSSRVSFHSSGQINLGAEVHHGPSLADFKRGRQLCLIQFVHPRRYVPPKRSKERDYDVGIVGYPVDEGKPMYGALIVQPWPSTEHLPSLAAPKLPSMTTWRTVGVGFRNLTSTPDLAIQLVIGHGVSGPWPELPAIIVALPR
jgi:hypothetical protein